MVLWGIIFDRLFNDQNCTDDMKTTASRNPRLLAGLCQCVRRGGAGCKSFQVMVSTDISPEWFGEMFEAAWWQVSLEGQNKVTSVGPHKVKKIVLAVSGHYTPLFPVLLLRRLPLARLSAEDGWQRSDCSLPSPLSWDCRKENHGSEIYCFIPQALHRHLFVYNLVLNPNILFCLVWLFIIPLFHLRYSGLTKYPFKGFT